MQVGENAVLNDNTLCHLNEIFDICDEPFADAVIEHHRVQRPPLPRVTEGPPVDAHDRVHDGLAAVSLHGHGSGLVEDGREETAVVAERGHLEKNDER